MRIERWYWLPIFCIISLLLHASLTLVRGSVITRNEGEPGSIEVAFEPAAPAPKPEPKIAKPEPKSLTKAIHPAAVVTPRNKFIAVHRTNRPVHVPSSLKPMPITQVRPIATPVVRKAVPVPELPEHILAETPDTAVRHDTPRTAPPRIQIARNDRHPMDGGGSPSPSPIPGGSGGLKAPEAPKEDVIYSGGGRGGENVLHEAPRIGGGGGNSILSVKSDNPLADAIPEDKPGIGPGLAGGIGNGNGGGVGSGAGRGIGTRPDGRVAIGTLRHRPGPGIGAAESGSKTGTRAPGGGRGTGSELPGTGGTGNGYQRGHGNGVGDGTEGGPSSKMRGVPFGDVAGLLGGDGAGRGGGSPGRGGVFGSRLSGGGGGAIHIIYALDISGSMRDGNKIGKAQQALIVALGQLRPSDTFNIILFKRDASTFSVDSVPATLANVANARSYVENLRIGDGTNISAAMDLAFGMNGISHIYLMSDGEPNGGIGDFNELRRFIRDKNTNGIKIDTLALGLGENFPGIRLLKGIADDNNGSFHYINLARIPGPSN